MQHKERPLFSIFNIHTYSIAHWAEQLHSFSNYHNIEMIPSKQLNQTHRKIWILLHFMQHVNTVDCFLLMHSYRLILLLRRAHGVLNSKRTHSKLTIFSKKKKLEIIITKPHNERTLAASSRFQFVFFCYSM